MIARFSMLCASAALAAGLAATPVRADEKAAAAVVALGLLGIAAMAHHDDHYREGSKPQTAQEIADFERGYRDGLHNEAYNSVHSSAAYGNGFDAGHKERANRLAYKHRDKSANAPDKVMRLCVGEASAKWTRNPRDIHVVAARKGSFSQASGQEFLVEVAAGHKHGVCRVSQNGTVFEIKKGRL